MQHPHHSLHHNHHRPPSHRPRCEYRFEMHGDCHSPHPRCRWDFRISGGNHPHPPHPPKPRPPCRGFIIDHNRWWW